MVTMMATTNNNNSPSAAIGRPAYFYNCCSSHPPPPYFDFGQDSNTDKVKMLITPSTSANVVVDEEDRIEEPIDNNNGWINDHIDRGIDYADDDGRNNNRIDPGGIDQQNRSIDLLNANYSSSIATCNMMNDDNNTSDDDVTNSRTIRESIDIDSEKNGRINAARSKSRAIGGNSITTAKQRAKSADISAFAATSITDPPPPPSSYLYCDSIIDGDAEMIKSADATPTPFRLVPTCKALRMAVLALYRFDDFDRAKIGQGFFSEVFKVRHKVTGEQMALKLNTMSNNRPNVLREVQTMRRLKHPNVLRFRGVCVDKGQLHALTEYCNGGSLEQLIKGGTSSSSSLAPFPWLLRAKLAADIARGMQYVHSCGYIHRDLTSKNVLLKRDDYDGVPYRYTAIIADFGLSCKIPKPGTKLAAVGTPYWMAPECLNDESYTEIADVFSYGIILCEVIARIDADPDFMPRTSTFGLDYVRFSELCPLDTPVDFLKLAFRCCLMDPNSRPNFDQIVQLALSLVKTLQEPPAPTLLPRQISHVLAANGVSPTHYATISNSPAYVGGGGDSFGQRFAVTNGTRMQLLSTPLKLIRCHSDIGISGSEGTPQYGDSDSIAKLVDDDRLSQSPSSALNRALAHRIAADDPFYKPADDGESVNPFAGDRRFAGGRKIVTDSCYASPSVLGSLDGPSTSMNGTTNGVGAAVLGVAACHRRLTIWKPGHGGGAVQSTPHIRRAHSLPCSPMHSSEGPANGFLYVDIKEISDCFPITTLDSSDDQQTIHKQGSPNHVQVRRVTQVFEEQDKLFVDNRQRQKKSMKKALTISATPSVDNADSVFTFCPAEPPELDQKTATTDNENRSVSFSTDQPVSMVDLKPKTSVVMESSKSTTTKRVDRVKRASRRQRKRKENHRESESSTMDDEPNTTEASCGGSLQGSCALL